MTQSLLIGPHDTALVTDLYQLTMTAAYVQCGHRPRATFEAFVRRLPERRNYLVFAGLEQVVDCIVNMRFTPAQIDWLRTQPVFAKVGSGFFDYLRDFRFRGDIWAMPEGTVFFANEPVMRVTAEIPEAQLVETYLLSMLTVQTAVASKAARVVKAARGRPVVEFGLRRAHGPQAGVYASRAAFIGGCEGTSNVFAAQQLGIPMSGTMAHSWIQSHDDEATAFARFFQVFPNHTVALVDTYDTVRGAGRAALLGKGLSAVRLDSGDLTELSKSVRKVLDEAGLSDTKIVASSDLNEDLVAEMLARGAPIDIFGVGTEMVVSRDAPSLSYVYKLVQTEQDGVAVPRAKLAKGKVLHPNPKQVYRTTGPDGRFVKDRLVGEHTKCEGEPLLQPVIREGKLLGELPSVRASRERCLSQVACVPEVLHGTGKVDYTVEVGEDLSKVTAEMIAKLGKA